MYKGKRPSNKATQIFHELNLFTSYKLFILQRASHLRVRSGSTERGQGEMQNVKTVVLHPEYYESNDTVPHNDIAILEVDTPFQFNEKTQQIDITDAEPKGGEIAFLSGWGALRVRKINPVNKQLISKKFEIVGRWIRSDSALWRRNSYRGPRRM